MPSFSSASESPNLTPSDTQAVINLLKSCNRALVTCQQSGAVDAKIAGLSDAALANANHEIMDLRDEANSLKRNPTLWFVVGLLVAGLTVKLVK
jgi:hypothetical protein